MHLVCNPSTDGRLGEIPTWFGPPGPVSVHDLVGPFRCLMTLGSYCGEILN